MNNHDEEESYLVPANQVTEQMWCKIGERGELEFVDWTVVERLAIDYDRTPPEARNDKLLIAKLMWLARQETIKELSKWAT